MHVENVVSVYTCSQTSLNACTCTNIMCKCCTKQAERASSFLSVHVCGCFIGCWVVGGLHDRCMVSAYVQAHSQKWTLHGKTGLLLACFPWALYLSKSQRLLIYSSGCGWWEPWSWSWRAMMWELPRISQGADMYVSYQSAMPGPHVIIIIIWCIYYNIIQIIGPKYVQA